MSRNIFVSHIFRSWKRHSILQASTLGVLAGTFFIICLFSVLGYNLNQVLSLWGDQVQMTVYLAPEASADDRSVVLNFLQEQEGIKNHRLISREEALQAFQTQIGSYAPDLLSDPEIADVIPESFSLSFESGFVENSDRMSTLATSLKKLVGVEDVTYGQEWVKSFSQLLGSLSFLSKFIIFILLAGSLLVIGNCIRSSVSQRRKEIEVLELVGATQARIRLPFVFEGTLMGLVSSSVALGICYVTLQILKSYGNKITMLSQMSQGLTFLPWTHIALILLSAAFVGGLGSYLCVKRLNTGWVNRE